VNLRSNFHSNQGVAVDQAGSCLGTGAVIVRMCPTAIAAYAPQSWTPDRWSPKRHRSEHAQGTGHRRENSRGALLPLEQPPSNQLPHAQDLTLPTPATEAHDPVALAPIVAPIPTARINKIDLPRPLPIVDGSRIPPALRRNFVLVLHVQIWWIVAGIHADVRIGEWLVRLVQHEYSKIRGLYIEPPNFDLHAQSLGAHTVSLLLPREVQCYNHRGSRCYTSHPVAHGPPNHVHSVHPRVCRYVTRAMLAVCGWP